MENRQSSSMRTALQFGIQLIYASLLPDWRALKLFAISMELYLITNKYSVLQIIKYIHIYIAMGRVPKCLSINYNLL